MQFTELNTEIEIAKAKVMYHKIQKNIQCWVFLF